jgi:hypothetical protein
MTISGKAIIAISWTVAIINVATLSVQQAPFALHTVIAMALEMLALAGMVTFSQITIATLMRRS